MDPEVVSQLGENQRFYADMRFKQLTLLMAGMTIFGAGIAQYPALQVVPGVTAPILLGVVAMLFVATIWIMEVRSTLYFAAQREAAPHLWRRPSNAPLAWINASNAVLLFHVGLYFGWWWLSLKWGLSIPWLASTFLLGALLVVFTAISYVPLWKYREDTPRPDEPTTQAEAAAG